MKKFLNWLKNLWGGNASKKVVDTAVATAEFLKAHEAEFVKIEELVREAEITFISSGQGASKWEWVVEKATRLWPILKPHVISTLTGIAVNILKSGK